MALTPNDVAQKEFSHEKRGYSVAEVDAFLDQVQAEITALHAALTEAKNAAAANEQKLAHYVEIESTLNNAFIAAQQSADEIKRKAQVEAEELVEKSRAEGERIFREATDKKQAVVLQAENEKRKIELEIARLQESENKFRKEYAALIAHFTAELKDIPVIEGVELGSGSEEVEVEEVEVEIIKEAPADVEVAAGEPAPQPAEVEAAAQEAPVAAPAPAAEAPAPESASAPSAYEAYGEVEDDLDIEEID